MTRKDLPQRRAADVMTFDHEGRRWTASAGRFADGTLAELFLDAHSSTSKISIALCLMNYGLIFVSCLQVLTRKA